jgi:ABC-type polar amino acid transport system ATPase subunit
MSVEIEESAAVKHTLGAPIIVMDHVVKRFGKLVALNDVSLQVRRGEVLMIIGPSGSGKSTLLRCINYLEVPDAGSVVIDGIDLSKGKANINKVREEVGMVFQRFELFPHLTVLENVCLAQIVVRGRSKQAAHRIGMDLLAKVGIPEKANAQPAQLSGGQQQRVAIARALAMQPKVMLFDEPTSALDPEMIKEVLDVIVDLAGQGMTLLCVTHEMGFARAVANRVVFMDEGQIMEEAPPARFFGNASSERAREFLSKVLGH